MIARAHRHHVEEEESYFVSMTDLMVGLLFIFIILLMFFALQFKDAREQTQDLNTSFTTEIDRLRNAEEVRKQILQDIQRLLDEQGIHVEILWEQGILRLPESVLFEKGRADLNDRGRHAIQALAKALQIVLPCFTAGPLSRRDNCPARTAIIEAIYIEGHTDSDQLTPHDGMRDNLDLSAMRATNTYRELLKASPDDGGRPEILDFENERGDPVLSVSGYGEYRPVEPDQSTEANKTLNRRIDIRILMATPESQAVQEIQNQLNDTTKGNSP